MKHESVLSDLRGIAQHEDAESQQALTRAVELIESMGHQIDTLSQLVKSSYRPKSDKVAPGQLALELMGYLAEQGGGTTESIDTNAAQTPNEEADSGEKRKNRRSGVKLLPTDEVMKEPSAAEKLCACGAEMRRMGYDTRRQIIHRPQELRMLVEKLAKFSCGCCKERVVTPKGTPKPIEEGPASSSLLASDIISCDDTRLMAKAHVYNDGSTKPLKGRLWLYISDVSETAYCEFTPNWKAVHPRKVLEGYTGTVQGDGYGGLNPLFGGPGGPKKAGCNDHGRRKFVAALRNGDRRAEKTVDIYRALYAVERQAKSEKMKPPDVLALRQLKSKPIWEALAEEAGRLKLEVEQKSTLGKAVTYWHRQRPFLAAFLDDGDLPIANAHVERLLRKNSLFVGSEEAGQR